MGFAQGFVASCPPGPRRVHLTAATLVLSSVLIGGCTSLFVAESYRKCARQAEAAIPLLPQALLQHQPDPDCTFRGPVSNPITAEEMRQKLDYEQQCYAAYERIVQARLVQLQDYVRKMIQRRKAAEACTRQVDAERRRAEAAPG